ncbi:hypothetical protein BG004_004701 [Podila humilis]|nr:hypothetical protein BG004_004701 [Podila humilis]
MDQSRQPDSLVVDYKEPRELEQIMDFSLPDQGVGPEGIFPTITQTLQYSVNTFSPRFMDKLYAGSSPIGVLAELLLSGLNGNSHVYHVSPVFTLMEIHVTRAVARLFGFNGELAGGLSCPGGSASNQLAMVTARNSLFPEIKRHGYFPRPSRHTETAHTHPYQQNHLSGYGKLIAFTSGAGHYSLEKSAVIMGMGSDNIVDVPVDSTGAMIPSELGIHQPKTFEKLNERLIQENIAVGHTPFFINATAGTTVLGAFDPIRPCGEIAKKYNCWLHVDGSWGGCTVFVPELAKTLLDGSELAQSITINPHKMLQTSLQCSLLLVPDTTIFPRANALNANYLFHGQSHDLGDGTLGCGRRSDAIKLFLAWKYYGKLGFQTRIEKSFSNVAQFVKLLAANDYNHQRIQMLPLGNDLKSEDGKTATSRPSLLQICFWYRPKGTRLIDWRGTESYWKQKDEEEEEDSVSVSGSPSLNQCKAAAAGAGAYPATTIAHDVSSPSSSSVSLASSVSDVSSAASSLSSASTGGAEDKGRTMYRGIILRDATEYQEAKAWMEKVTKVIHARIRVRGQFMLDYAPLGRYLPLFFRVVLNPPTIRELDLEMLVKEMLTCGDAVAGTVPVPECCRE